MREQRSFFLKEVAFSNGYAKIEEQTEEEKYVKKIKFGSTDLEISSVILGLMRINNAKDPVAVLTTAIENGITFFDHADIYGGGECESIFADALAQTEYKGKIFSFNRNVVSSQENVRFFERTHY